MKQRVEFWSHAVDDSGALEYVANFFPGIPNGKGAVVGVYDWSPAALLVEALHTARGNELEMIVDDSFCNAVRVPKGVVLPFIALLARKYDVAISYEHEPELSLPQNNHRD